MSERREEKQQIEAFQPEENGDWVKIHRRIFKHPIAKDGTTLLLWFYIICHAAWKPCRERVGNKLVELSRGSLIFIERRTAAALHVAKTTLRRDLEFLQQEGCIRTVRGPRYSVVEVLNYNKYQSKKIGPWTEDGPIADRSRTESGPIADRSRTELELEPLQDTASEAPKNIRSKEDKEEEDSICKISPVEPEISQPKKERTDYKGFVSAWNDNCGTLPKCSRLSDERRRHIKARLSEEPRLDYWIAVARRLAASEFCRGSNKNGWVADFAFFIRPDTHVKANEGKYDNREVVRQVVANQRWAGIMKNDNEDEILVEVNDAG